LISWLFEGIQVSTVGRAFVAALFLGIFNALIRPVLLIMTLPINLLTLGLFTLVINGLMLWLTAWLLDGFEVHGFWAAVGGALVMSLISWLSNGLVNDRGKVEVIHMQMGPHGRWERRE
jgi:putative membrane protein